MSERLTGTVNEPKSYDFDALATDSYFLPFAVRSTKFGDFGKTMAYRQSLGSSDRAKSEIDNSAATTQGGATDRRGQMYRSAIPF
jgi:hypothetical protein